MKSGTIDWSKVVSRQIAVYKTDNALLELTDSLKPSHSRFPAHIHAAGEKEEDGERSLIRLQMVDYSTGTGEKSVSVYAYISPEDACFLYSRVFCGVQDFSFGQEKIFGSAEEEGYAIVTKLYIARYACDRAGKAKNYPWHVRIQNGIGIKQKNQNGGTFCKKDSCIMKKEAGISLKDEEMFRLFCRADSWIKAFEQEHAFGGRRRENFGNLYKLLKKEIGENFAAMYRYLDKKDRNVAGGEDKEKMAA